jgi:hypothetical protein
MPPRGTRNYENAEKTRVSSFFSFLGRAAAASAPQIQP